MNITITASYDGNSISHVCAYGTTAAQVAATAYVRNALGVPANSTPMVNGQYSTAALNDGDVVTFESAPARKA